MAFIRVLNRRGEDGLELRAPTATHLSILNALLRAGVRVRHDCGGHAQCGTCRLRVLGEGSGLSPVGRAEAERLAASVLPGESAPGSVVRLACQARTARDIDVELIN
ncbi:MAG TPA: 2Fe-2S iron-sulfur cluster-binding protein [Rectinemataceae bacterium]|nr:2Fe-2S iron-sulfur cluster-binding protein [Rectinemataceae bacterium]